MGELFGTFGIRGIANEKITPELSYKLGLALSTYLDGDGKVSVGHDPRTSSEMIEHALVSGINSGGCDVLRFGMVPTPVLSFGTKHFSCDSGIMITASHNPPRYNGLKFWDDTGAGFVREKEDEIERLVEKGGETVSWKQIGESRKVDAITPYRKAINERISDFDRDIKVILDCANGAGSDISPKVLSDLGCHVVTMNSQADGRFPGRMPEPTEENIGDLINAVTSMDADLGIAHDGDADRTIIVDEKGNPLSGDRVFAFAAMNYLRNKDGPRIITSVPTSSVLDDVAEKLDGELVRTKVGEPELVRELRKNGGELAGEENGGVIFPDWAMSREGIMTAVQFVDYVARTGKPASEINETLPEYKQLKKKIDCPDKLKPKVLEDLSQKLDHYTPNRTDGLRIDFDDGWFMLRPSGTQPIFRCFSEAKTEERAGELAEEGMKALKESLDSVK